MTHLKRNGIVVFLHADLETLNKRVHDFSERGLAKGPDQTLDDLFMERFSLYTAYADITIDSCRLTHEEVCACIIGQIG
jgi:shikimate kinase